LLVGLHHDRTGPRHLFLVDSGHRHLVLAVVDEGLVSFVVALMGMGRRVEVPPGVVFAVLGPRPDVRLEGVEALVWDGPDVAWRHAALADDLVERDPRHDGDIQGRHVAEERDRDDVVTSLTHQPPHPLPLAAENDGDGPLVVDGVPSLTPFGVEPHDPEPSRLEALDGLGHVAYPSDLHVLEGASRGPRHGLREPRTVAVGEQHAVGAGRLGRAEYRPEVARVLDAVQDHDQARVVGLAQEVLDGHDRLRRHNGDHALMRQPSGHAVQCLPRLETERHSHLGGAGHGLGDSLVPNPLHDEEAVEVPGPGAERLQDRVDAADEIHERKILVFLVALN
jgi:hypothetical protein